MSAFSWPYFDLVNGTLCQRDRNGEPVKAFPNLADVPTFANVVEAEAWLVANDLRGNVRD